MLQPCIFSKGTSYRYLCIVFLVMYFHLCLLNIFISSFILYTYFFLLKVCSCECAVRPIWLFLTCLFSFSPCFEIPNFYWIIFNDSQCNQNLGSIKIIHHQASLVYLPYILLIMHKLQYLKFFEADSRAGWNIYNILIKDKMIRVFKKLISQAQLH